VNDVKEGWPVRVISIPSNNFEFNFDFSWSKQMHQEECAVTATNERVPKLNLKHENISSARNDSSNRDLAVYHDTKDMPGLGIYKPRLHRPPSVAEKTPIHVKGHIPGYTGYAAGIRPNAWVCGVRRATAVERESHKQGYSLSTTTKHLSNFEKGATDFPTKPAEVPRRMPIYRETFWMPGMRIYRPSNDFVDELPENSALPTRIGSLNSTPKSQLSSRSSTASINLRPASASSRGSRDKRTHAVPSAVAKKEHKYKKDAASQKSAGVQYSRPSSAASFRSSLSARSLRAETPGTPDATSHLPVYQDSFWMPGLSTHKPRAFDLQRASRP
jgi:hypothetical protein